MTLWRVRDHVWHARDDLWRARHPVWKQLANLKHNMGTKVRHIPPQPHQNCIMPVVMSWVAVCGSLFHLAYCGVGQVRQGERGGIATGGNVPYSDTPARPPSLDLFFGLNRYSGCLGMVCCLRWYNKTMTSNVACCCGLQVTKLHQREFACSALDSELKERPP